MFRTQLRAIIVCAVAGLFITVPLFPGNADGQQKSLKEQIVGTRKFVLVDTVHPAAIRVPMCGAILRELRFLMRMDTMNW